ncbi:MAG: hypothetical protein K9L74_02635 [Candidatus Izimaplasma sp.]|nr:hypothetical protein [Candidatus Izimaplasma bacterium]
MDDLKRKMEISYIKDRKKRILVMSYLLIALIFTIIYGTLQSPFEYNLSNIGNGFSIQNRILFIVWASYTGFTLSSSIFFLFYLENYKNQRHYSYISISVIFLVLTAVIPSTSDLLFWSWIHVIAAGLFGLFITLGFYPFAMYIANENKHLKRVIYIWISVIWLGSILSYFMFVNKGIFEIWFFIAFIVFLLYLSLILYEKNILIQNYQYYEKNKFSD